MTQNNDLIVLCAVVTCALNLAALIGGMVLSWGRFDKRIAVLESKISGNGNPYARSSDIANIKEDIERLDDALEALRGHVYGG